LPSPVERTLRAERRKLIAIWRQPWLDYCEDHNWQPTIEWWREETIRDPVQGSIWRRARDHWRTPHGRQACEAFLEEDPEKVAEVLAAAGYKADDQGDFEPGPDQAPPPSPDPLPEAQERLDHLYAAAEAIMVRTRSWRCPTQGTIAAELGDGTKRKDLNVEFRVRGEHDKRFQWEQFKLDAAREVRRKYPRGFETV
jgi:hypothetical protein